MWLSQDFYLSRVKQTKWAIFQNEEKMVRVPRYFTFGRLPGNKVFFKA